MEGVQLGMASYCGAIILTPRRFCGKEKTMDDTDEANFPESVEFQGYARSISL